MAETGDSFSFSELVAGCLADQITELDGPDDEERCEYEDHPQREVIHWEGPSSVCERRRHQALAPMVATRYGRSAGRRTNQERLLVRIGVA